MEKWNQTSAALLVALACVGFVACGDDETTNNTTANNTTANSTTANNTTAGPVNECEPYEPTAASGTESQMWPEQEAEVTFQITIPDDPGGGWVEIQSTTANLDISPRIDVRYQDPDGAIVAASAGGQPDEQTATAYFEAAPGLTYDVTIDQFGNANANEYPVDVTTSWTFTSVVDCYEPNSLPTEAKKIPFDEQIEAYTLAGYRENRFDNPSLSDWYEVTLDEDGIIDVDVTQVPGENRMSIRIFDNPDEPTVGGGSGDVGAAFMASTEDPVPAGTYLIEVVTADAETRNASFDDPLPNAWSTPYQFTATTR